MRNNVRKDLNCATENIIIHSNDYLRLQFRQSDNNIQMLNIFYGYENCSAYAYLITTISGAPEMITCKFTNIECSY